MLSYDVVNSGGSVVTNVQISPYLLVLNENSALPTAFELNTENGFIGVGIYAGRYYDDNHSKRDKFANPNIREQVNWAKENNIPFGLLGYIDARNEAEAQEEFKQLYLVLMTYPPNIGLWLRIKSSGAKSEINNIIEWYQKMLINRGFRYQIGFYNTKDELERFDWQKFCNNRAGVATEYKDFDRTSVSNYFANDWNLWWLDKPTGDEFEQTNDLLRPNFFKLIPAGTSTANASAYVTPRI